MRLPASLYQQFAPATAGGTGAAGAAPDGWLSVDVELSPAHTALVVMHAWDCGPPESYPGWRRAVEYHPRADRILQEVFPRLLKAVRDSFLPVFHVVGGPHDYYSHLPGYRRTAALAGSLPVGNRPALVPADPIYDHLRRLRAAVGFPGAANAADVAAGLDRLDFAPTARPLEHEGIAADGHQLAALCRTHGINHLVYVGFALNWCLLMAPGGMVDMARHGCLCSTIREAVTAVENRATAAAEREKEQALWRVAVEFGFVFALDPFISALPRSSSASRPATTAATPPASATGVRPTEPAPRPPESLLLG